MPVHGAHAENDNAASRSSWKLKRGKQKESVGAREAHQRARFLKVQVQDLSDCQAALCFWFHINAVSFLPPLSFPHLRRSLLLSICCFSSAPPTPQRSRTNPGSLAAIRFSDSYICFAKFSHETNARKSLPAAWWLACLPGQGPRFTWFSPVIGFLLDVRFKLSVVFITSGLKEQKKSDELNRNRGALIWSKSYHAAYITAANSRNRLMIGFLMSLLL